jgi:hypothetical protein
MGADGRNVRNWSFGPFYFHRLTERLFATRGVFLGLKFAYAGRKRPVDIGRTVLLCHGQQLTDGEVEGRNGHQEMQLPARRQVEQAQLKGNFQKLLSLVSLDSRKGYLRVKLRIVARNRSHIGFP